MFSCSQISQKADGPQQTLNKKLDLLKILREVADLQPDFSYDALLKGITPDLSVMWSAFRKVVRLSGFFVQSS
jgi:hypothetical protein